jgi:Ca2+-binding EF-hand superfamily protein
MVSSNNCSFNSLQLCLQISFALSRDFNVSSQNHVIRLIINNNKIVVTIIIEMNYYIVFSSFIKGIFFMKTKICLVSSIVLGFTISVAAVAEPKTKRLLEAFDVNQDGSMTTSEVKQVLTKRFKANDSDGDGFLNFNETVAAYEQAKQERAVKRFNKIDQNGDGAVTLDEFLTTVKKYSAYKERLIQHRFTKKDKNNDELVSLTEFTEPLPFFDHFDFNKDNVISLEEITSKFNHHK